MVILAFAGRMPVVGFSRRQLQGALNNSIPFVVSLSNHERNQQVAEKLTGQ